MKFNCPLIVVDDIIKSRNFYENVLNQKVKFDFGENITFEGDFSLQSNSSWAKFINKSESEIINNSNNFELYFEEEDFDTFINKLKEIKSIEYVNEVKEYSWGQRVVRFYDLDGHIIEVGESMKTVVKKFLAQGLSIEETAERTQHPVDFVKSCI